MPINERGEYIRDRDRPEPGEDREPVRDPAPAWDTEPVRNIPPEPDVQPVPVGSTNRGGRRRALIFLALAVWGGAAVWRNLSGSAGNSSAPAKPVASSPETPSPAFQTSHEVLFSNGCSQPLKLYVSYTNSAGNEGAAVGEFAPNESGYLTGGYSENGRIKAAGGEVFYFARMVNPERNYFWQGEFTRLVAGASYKMRRVAASGDQTLISIPLDCTNFWRIKARNSCNEEISSIVLHYNSLMPGAGLITQEWSNLPPNSEFTFPLTQGGYYAETTSPGYSPHVPGGLYYFARSRNHGWWRDDNRDSGKTVLFEGRTLDMKYKQLAPGDVGPHLDFTCPLQVQPPPIQTWQGPGPDPVASLRNKLAYSNVDQVVNVIRVAPNKISITVRQSPSRSDAEKIVRIVREEMAASSGVKIEVSCSIARRAGEEGRFLGC